MRQRAALIRTLVMEPDILLLDEPFSALDYQTRLNVTADVARILRSEKKAALLITHDISEAISLADRVSRSSRPVPRGCSHDARNATRPRRRSRPSDGGRSPAFSGWF